MKIENDTKYDIKYIKIKKGKVAKTKPASDSNILLDYSSKGEVLGIEILDSSKYSVSVLTIGGKYAGHSFRRLAEKKPQGIIEIESGILKSVVNPLHRAVLA